MMLKTTEYEKHLKEEIPDFSFQVDFHEQYKSNEEIYRISINEIERDYFMLIGRYDFTEEEQKENFVTVANTVIKTYNKEMKELEKEKKETK